MLTAKPGQSPGQIYQTDPQNFRQGILGNVPQIILAAVLADKKQVQQIAELDKGTVVVLVSRLKQKQIGIGSVPVDDKVLQIRIFMKHGRKLFLGKFQNFCVKKCEGYQRVFDFIMGLVISRKHGSRPMEGDYFPLAGIMFQGVLNGAGENIMDFAKRLSRFPQIVSSLEGTFLVWTG